MRTFARIHRSLLQQNFENIRQAVGPKAAILAVVKADAYGHGAVEVARALAAVGAGHFAVACLEEAVALRSAGIEGEVLILGGLEPGQESAALEHRLTPVIQTRCQLQDWQKQAAAAQQQLPCHIEIDTGMNRLGMQISSASDLAGLLREASSLRLEGIATHLASADDFADDQTNQQRERFDALIAALRESGIQPRYIHQSNSAAVAYRPAMDLTMVRPGLAIYGYVSPSSGPAPASRLQVRPVLEWKTRIHSIKDVAAGSRLGYYGAYRAERPLRAAVLPVGYGDGLNRRMSEGGEVVVRGARCPILGLLSMDLTTIDLSSVPEAAVGDEVTLIGPMIDAQVMAERCGTIVYETLCGISKRVPRIYGD